jgi:hypothetical protein
MAHDLAASVRARLLNIAKTEQTDFNSVLVRYALERFLYRLGQSAHADHFILKGAMLFNLWYAICHNHIVVKRHVAARGAANHQFANAVFDRPSDLRAMAEYLNGIDDEVQPPNSWRLALIS